MNISHIMILDVNVMQHKNVQPTEHGTGPGCGGQKNVRLHKKNGTQYIINVQQGINEKFYTKVLLVDLSFQCK